MSRRSGLGRCALLASLLALACGGSSAPITPAPSDLSSQSIASAATAAAPGAGSATSSPRGAPAGAKQEPPAQPEPSFLKGQLHVHSSGSYDAKEPPEAVLRFYAERGYDFVALSDHNQVTKPAVVPEGMLWVPGVELTQNAATCAPPPPRGYRCLFHTGGLLLEDTTPVAVKLPYRAERYAAYQQQLGWVEARGGLAVIYHPSFHFAVDARLLTRLSKERGVRLFEVSNGALDAQHPAGRARAEERSEALWDAALSAGATLYGVATDDAHHFSEAPLRAHRGRSVYGGDRGWVRVRAEPTLSSLREALRAGDFYASTGVELTRLVRSRERVSFDIQGGTPPWTTRYIGVGGKLLLATSGASARYEPRGDEGYVRAVVRDAAGLSAWVQPVLLGAPGDASEAP